MVETTHHETVLLFVAVNGQDLSEKYAYSSILVEKQINKISAARVVIHDGDTSERKFSATEADEFRIGGDIEIKVGYHSQLKTVFKGVIVGSSINVYGLQHSTLTLECRDAAYRTTLRRRNVSCHDMTDSECISQILEKYAGIESQVAPTTVLHEALLQCYVSDWDFINLRAEANGRVVINSNNAIKIKKIDTSQPPQKTFTYGEDIIDMSLTMDSREQIEGARGVEWNPADLETKIVESSEISEKSFGTVDSSILARSTREKNFELYNDAILAQEELKTLADAVVDFSRIAKICGHIVVDGLHGLDLGEMIKLESGSAQFSGEAYVSGISHIVEHGGWQTKLTLGLPSIRYMDRYTDVCSLPAAGVIAPPHGLQIGTVKKIVGDPKDLERIFVHLPVMHKDGEGVWCRLASPYASEEVGMVFFPEVGSEVVVAFVNSDPRSPVVVGSMFGAKHRSPVEINELNSKKIIKTKEKLEISFDEEKKEILIQVKGATPRLIKICDEDASILIENGETSKVRMNAEGIELSTKGDIKLSADGAIQLKAGAEVNLEAMGEANLKGMLVNVKAETRASVEGAACAELKSCGETVVRGILVRIN